MTRSNSAHALAIVALAATTSALVALLVVASTDVGRFVAALPDIAAPQAPVIAVVALVLIVVLCSRVLREHRVHTRERALARRHTGTIAAGIRTRQLTSALAELQANGSRIRLESRFSATADASGVEFWSGGRRPRRAGGFTWREVRSIRSDEIVIGTSRAPVLVLRIRRDGASLDVPLLLAASEPTEYALVEAPFFALVREWKAKHRAAFEAEGLEPPPMTAPIPIIRDGRAMVAAARP